MTGEEIPDHIDLHFIARQQARILAKLSEMRGDFAGVREHRKHVPPLRADDSESQHAMAATRADIAIVKDTVEKIYVAQQIHGARLNVTDGRIATIEKHTGLVKA